MLRPRAHRVVPLPGSFDSPQNAHNQSAPRTGVDRARAGAVQAGAVQAGAVQAGAVQAGAVQADVRQTRLGNPRRPSASTRRPSYTRLRATSNELAISDAPTEAVEPGRVRLEGELRRALRVIAIDASGPRCAPYYTLQLAAPLSVGAASWDPAPQEPHRVQQVELVADADSMETLDELVDQKVLVTGTVFRTQDSYTNVSLRVHRVRARSTWLASLA